MSNRRKPDAEKTVAISARITKLNLDFVDGKATAAHDPLNERKPNRNAALNGIIQKAREDECPGS